MKICPIFSMITPKNIFYIFFLLPFFLWNCKGSDQKASQPSKINLLPYHHVLGNQLFSFQTYNKAIEEYKKALEIDPNYSPAIQGLGNSYFRLKKYEQAIKNWKKSLTLLTDEKQKVAIYFNIGIASFEIKEKEGSLFYTFKALQLSTQYRIFEYQKLAKRNLEAFKRFYNLTDAEVIDIVKHFKAT
jgi:tetratricopeptide (TPR) repeat protein